MVKANCFITIQNWPPKPFQYERSLVLHVRSLVVSDLRLETKGSGSSPAASYVQR